MMNFIKIHMITTSYRNARLIDDPEKSKVLSPYLIKHAQCLRKAPSLIGWTMYMLDVNSAASAGPTIEYSVFNQWVNVEGDFAKMRPCSNLIATIKRVGTAFFLGLFVAQAVNSISPKKEFFEDVENMKDLSLAKGWFFVIAFATTRRIRMNAVFTF